MNTPNNTSTLQMILSSITHGIPNAHSAGGVVLNKKGQILLVQQGHVSWSFPKGHLNSGEDSLSAAKREIHEETGIDELELVAKIGSYVRTGNGFDGQENPSILKRITLYLFYTTQEGIGPLADPAISSIGWFDKNQVVGLLTHPKDKLFFQNFVI